jgi:hypothetical protein
MVKFILLPFRDLDQEPRRAPPPTDASNLGENNNTSATVVRDSTNWLSNVKALQETDVIILLTPVVVPISQDPTDTSDPFEPLGRSLAKRHPRIRHVPYTQRWDRNSQPNHYADLVSPEMALHRHI